MHSGAAADLRHSLHRRRYQPYHQRRVSDSGGRAIYLRVLRRLRHQCGGQQGTVGAEPRGLCRAHRAALRLPGLQQRRLPGRYSRLPGRVRKGHSSGPRHQLCAPHVHRRGALGDHAHHQRAIPALLSPTTRCASTSGPYCNDVSQWRETRQLSCNAKLITRSLFPPGGAGDLHLPASHRGLWAAEHLPRAAQDVPADDLDHVLKAGNKKAEDQESIPGPLCLGSSRELADSFAGVLDWVRKS